MAVSCDSVTDQLIQTKRLNIFWSWVPRESRNMSLYHSVLKLWWKRTKRQT